MEGLNIQRTPSAGVVLPHYIFGALSFLALSLMIVFSTDTFSGHYFHPKLLSITHTAVLGWGSMIIFGALYQLLPVILETPLYSELLARITFWLFAAGIICLAFSFWKFYVGIHIQIASCLIVLAFSLFTFNIIRTAKSAVKWTIEADFITTSSLWLLTTGILGLLMAFNFQYAFLPKSHLLFLKIHAHLGIAGWFILLIMGVTSKLVPMFLLTHHLNVKKLSYAYYLVNLGLIIFTIDLFFNEISKLAPIYALTIVSGILCFLSFIYEAYRKRARKQLDIGLRHTFIAFAIFFLPVFIGVYLSFKSSENSQIYLVYGSSIFLGFITSLILGQTFKTLPFIVWLHKYRKLVGKQKTPLPKDLYSEKLAQVQLIIYLSAMLFLLSGIFFNISSLIRLGSVLLFLTAILYNMNVFKIMFINAVIKNLNEGVV